MLVSVHEDGVDGTEVAGTSWLDPGLPNGLDAIGFWQGVTYEPAFTFSLPSINGHLSVAGARLTLPATGHGTLPVPLSMRLVGLLPDSRPFSEWRPSQRAQTQASVLWTVPSNWPGRKAGEPALCDELRRTSPDISPIINELLATNGHSATPTQVSLYLQVVDPPAATEDYVTFEDSHLVDVLGCANPAARLHLYPTVRSAFVGAEIIGRVSDVSATVTAYSMIPLTVYFAYGTHPQQLFCQTPTQTFPAETQIAHVLSNLVPDARFYYQIWYRTEGASDFVAGPIHSFHTQRATGKSFAFALVSDSHIPPHRYDERGTQLYRRTLDNVHLDGPDFLLDLGDTFYAVHHTLRNAADYRECVDRHLDQRPYFGRAANAAGSYFVLGNHEGEQGWRRDDTGDNLAIWAARARKDIYSNPRPDSFYSGFRENDPWVGDREAVYSWQWGDALFLVLDPYWFTMDKPHNAGHAPKTGDRWSWTLGAPQYEWLREQLEASTARFKFVFAHQVTGGVNDYGRGGIKAARHSLSGTGSYEWGGEQLDGTDGFGSRRPGWADPIHDLMVRNNVTVFFHGHDHVFAHETLDGVTYQTLPTPSDANYGVGFKDNANIYEFAVKYPNAGHVLIGVESNRVTVTYVRSFLPGDGVNRDRAHSYAIFDCNRNGVVDSKEFGSPPSSCND